MTTPVQQVSGTRNVWRFAIPTVVANAAVQAVLLWGDPTPSLTWWIWPLALASFASIVVTLTIIIAALQFSRPENYSWRSLMNVIGARILPMIAYTAFMLAVIILGFALWILPGLIAIAATPYLLFAVMDAVPNPLRSNFRAIRAKWSQWFALLVISGIAVGATWGGSALLAFFVPDSIGVAITWLIYGFIGTVLLQLWSRAWQRVK